MQGRLPPGSRVVEAEIARQMAISRAPVREASRRLERQGILVSRPRRGFFVREMSVREIDDLFQVRLSLEMTAVAAACEHADAAGLARLRGLLELMIAEAADAPQHRRIELDLSFHTLICELSGNAYLLRLFSSTQTEMRMIISLIDNVYQDPEMVAATPAHPGRAGAPRCTGRAGLHEGTSGRCLGARPQPVRLAAWRGGRKPRGSRKT